MHEHKERAGEQVSGHNARALVGQRPEHASSGVQEVACGDEVGERKGSSPENDECVGVAAVGLREVDPHAAARALHNKRHTDDTKRERGRCLHWIDVK